MKTFSLSKFSNEVKGFRKHSKLSQEKASQQIDVSEATLSRIENQKLNPDINTFYKCCRWVGKSMDLFFE